MTRTILAFVAVTGFLFALKYWLQNTGAPF